MSIGHTALKELVSDHTKSRRAIKFTVQVTVGSPGQLTSKTGVPVTFSVLGGYGRQAADLVRRYRQERLQG